MLRILDLFSGIGGFSLGLERTGGFRTVAFCEIEPFCRSVLRHHWPEVPIYEDVRAIDADRLAADGVAADVVCGGFPCQDISVAGAGAGLDGERSGLWFEMLRIIAETRPRWVIAENVSALRSRGLDTVLRGLAAVGYDAEWHCIPAAAVGAPHRRDRIWIVAYPNRDGELQPAVSGEAVGLRAGICRQDVAHPNRARLAQREGVAGDDGPKLTAVVGSGWWASEPDVGRVAHGVPGRVDRLRALGNAVVPQIPELIGRAILQQEEAV